MKNIFAIAALSVATLAATANAASLSVVKAGSAATRTFSLYLNGGAQNGAFDTVSLTSAPSLVNGFANPNSGLSSGAARPAGAVFTFRNRLLDTDPLDDPNGKGWSVLGAVTTAAALAFDGGPLGLKISTAGEQGGNLFLANYNIPLGGGSATVQLFNSGAPVGGPMTISFIPEPATLAMASMGLLGMIAASRRRKA